MSRHKATSVRPRYGRISVLGASLAVTVVAVLGGTGALPSALTGASPSAAVVADDPSGRDPADTADTASLSDATSSPSPSPTAEDEAPASGGTAGESAGSEVVDPREDETLPPDSGEGRRVVFSESRQRVWLVGASDDVRQTYLASGSLSDNLDPGTYSVYSRSEDAVGIDDSGTMKYFVRFTQGDSGAAIGFHDIPILDGERVQTYAQLGTPQSHGCIRQRRSDAIALWDFAPLGTTVVVTA